MPKGDNVIKVQVFCLTLITTFFLGGLLQAQNLAQQEGVGFKEGLSYTEDHTWFAKKDWQNGLSEVTQSRQSQPWRMATWEERVNYFISRLRKGDRKAFLYVNYGLLDGYGNPYTHKSVRGYPTNKGSIISRGVLWHLLAKAKKLNLNIENTLTDGSPEIRKNVVNAVLSGLFNKDPRVRLIAINLLRRLRPDTSMAKDVKRAMILETVTTERSKWREKDIDIPSIEQPRLGWAAVSWNGVDVNRVNHSIRQLWNDGSANGEKDILNGNDKGRYLSEGIYRRGHLNYFPGTIQKRDYSDPNKESISARVWLKSSLLRYGADNNVSNFETRYGLTERESIPKYTYLYSDPINPKTQQVGENLYYGYHSIWEEMKKLELFVTRAIWVEKIKSGDINAFRNLSKDSFRALADQIDGESLENVPMKSKSFKTFGEAEVRAIIVGMLENRVVSTREECIRFLLRIFEEPNLSIAIKKEIKKSLREARRRELIIDSIRGRHVHALLVVTQQPDDWWGEEDEVNSSSWSKYRGQKLQEYRNQIEFPEESDIIYHDRRKPGQEESEEESEEEGEEESEEESEEEGEEESEEEGEENLYKTTKKANFEEFPPEGFYGHPLLKKAFEAGYLTFEDIDEYLQLSSFLGGKVTLSNQNSNRILPGQYPGLVKKSNPKSTLNRSVVATRYEIVRAIETLHSLLLGNVNDLLRVNYLDLQNALLIMQWQILKDAQEINNSDELARLDFLQYVIAASAVVNTKGRRFHGHNNLTAELERTQRAKKNLANLFREMKSNLHNSNYQIRYHSIGLELNQIKKLREEHYKSVPKIESQKSGSLPGRSNTESEIGVSHREESLQSHGKFYGHGRGGYYNFYDQQIELFEAKNDVYKNKLGFYQLPIFWKQQRTKMVGALLASIVDKDPQKRLLIVHLLRRLIPDTSMLPRVNKLLREIETIDKRPYKFFDTVLNKNITLFNSKYENNNNANHELDEKENDSEINSQKNNKAKVYFSVQEKIVGHELLKLQRFIVRRILVNKIRNGGEASFLKEIPKGSFLTLILRIDAEWDPFRIPLKTTIVRNQDGSNGMFFDSKDINVIRGGLENPNFIIQRETARWIISFLNHNYGTGNMSISDFKKFVQAIKFAERRDIVYYERNYVKWKYSNDFSRTEYISGDPTVKTVNVTGVPLGRVPVRIGSRSDTAVFRSIDLDRKREFEDDYGRVKGKSDFNQFEEPKATLDELVGQGGNVRRAYRKKREEREKQKNKLGDKTRRNGKFAPRNSSEENYQQQGLDFRGQ